MLQVKNLKKHFGGVKAVNNCSFKIDKGKITALIGPNGSGKTTVFNLISGIHKEDQGKILLNQKDITNHSIEKVSNEGISRVFQQSRMFSNLTVEENLLLALDNQDTSFWKNIIGYKKDTKNVNETLKLVKMEKHRDKKSNDLSFGQKRLTEIGRALLKPHELLMLDEPVAGVTPSLRNSIATLLKKLRKEGETILIIEHDMEFIMNIADWIIVMDEGKVIVEGTPNFVKNNPKVLEAYLGD